MSSESSFCKTLSPKILQTKDSVNNFDFVLIYVKKVQSQIHLLAISNQAALNQKTLNF